MFFILALSLIGFCISLILAYGSVINSAAICGPGGGCASILSSSFADFLGIPVSILSVGFYLIILFLIFRFRRKFKKVVIWIFDFSMIAFFVALFLSITQLFFLEGFCKFCFMNFIVITLLFGVSFWDRYKYHYFTRFFSFPNWKVVWPGIVLCFFIPIIAYGMFQVGHVFTSTDTRAGRVVVSIGDKRIKLKDIDQDMQAEISNYEIRKNMIRRQLIDEEVLSYEAKKREMSIKELLNEEVDRKVVVSNKEISNFYNEKKDIIPKTMAKDHIYASIKDHLRLEKRNVLLQVFIDKLYKKHNVNVDLPGLKKYKVPPNPYGSPLKGDKNAYVKLVVFTDFQCSHCEKAHRSMQDKLNRKFPGKFMLEYRFYLNTKKEKSRLAAQAGVCAFRQNKFWEFADILYKKRKRLSKKKIIIWAKSMGMDINAFQDCLKSAWVEHYIASDIEAAKKLGITGSPCYIANGQLVLGEPSYEQMRIWLQEAAKKKK